MHSLVISALLGATVIASTVQRAKSSTASGKPFDGLDASVTTIAYDDHTFTARAIREQHSRGAFKTADIPTAKPPSGRNKKQRPSALT